MFSSGFSTLKRVYEIEALRANARHRHLINRFSTLKRVYEIEALSLVSGDDVLASFSTLKRVYEIEASPSDMYMVARILFQ